MVLKATASRNLHMVLCGVSYLQACMGDELTTSTLPSDMLEEVVSHMLSVITTSKVNNLTRVYTHTYIDIDTHIQMHITCVVGKIYVV